MKKIITYIAFDNTEFSTEKECLDYEAGGYKFEIEKTEKRLQQLKSGELAEEYTMYKKALDRYRFVCTNRVSDNERSSAYDRYINTKNRYNKSVVYYHQTKKRLAFLKKKDIEV